MKRQRGFLNITTADMVFAAAVLILTGGFIVYVVLPWLWSVLIKPALLWILS